jgi:hypothetical protein
MTNMIVSHINIFEQDINDKDIQQMLCAMYDNIRFSTFPYLTYKCEDSETAMNTFNSGNCIALSFFIKSFLKRNMNIESSIICASVPDIFKVENTPHACHCALLVPKSEHEFYIIDTAFSFLSGMYCDIANNVRRKIECSDIYSYKNQTIQYRMRGCDNEVIDEKFGQTLLPDTLKVDCCFDFDKSQRWEYYLNEVQNPDESIGVHFLREKSRPFMLYTYYDYDENKVKLMFKLYINQEGDLMIKEYPEGNVVFSTENATDEQVQQMKNVILKYMPGHFDDYIV